MDYIIETKGLTKKFGSKIAVNNVDMHIKKGDIYGFIGANGAGKTTLMKMLLGLTRVTQGEIKLFDSTNLDESRKRIGSLIEAPGLYKNCTALENMKRFAIFTNSNIDEIKELLEFVGLSNIEKKRVGKFSLGMKQRLGIAIALLGNPEILILDEPINGLDPEGIKEIRDTILKLNKERNVTFLISSHLLDELSKITTRYGIINNGVLVDEIEASILEEKSRHSLTFKVNDIDKAKEILVNNNYLTSYEIKDDYIILYDHLDEAASINKLLVRNDILVSEIKTNTSNLEDYFIERMGR